MAQNGNTATKPTAGERKPGEPAIAWASFRALWSADDELDNGARRGHRVRLAAYGLWTLALIVVFVTWNGAATRAYVALQVPYVVSGGLTALLLTIIGSTLFVAGFLADAAASPRSTPPQ